MAHDTLASSQALSWPEPTSSSSRSEIRIRSSIPGSFEEDSGGSYEGHTEEDIKPLNTDHPQTKLMSDSSGLHSSQTWPPRTCRICLETVHPTYIPTDHLPSFLHGKPQFTYTSEDPSLGRLIRPCKCKGSSRYVHEGCLQSWRHADPSYGSRNFWQCPTCGFRYHLQRIGWGRAISSVTAQIFLTIGIFLLATFILGFFGDTVIGIYLDPYDTFTSGVGTKGEPLFHDETQQSPGGWLDHFIKGLASLGLLGFVKVFFALSPLQWWNLRVSGIFNGQARAGTSGRTRLANLSWPLIVLGVVTFLWSVFKGVRAWSRRTLERASERVVDVPLDDEANDGDEITGSTASS